MSSTSLFRVSCLSVHYLRPIILCGSQKVFSLKSPWDHPPTPMVDPQLTVGKLSNIDYWALMLIPSGFKICALSSRLDFQTAVLEQPDTSTRLCTGKDTITVSQGANSLTGELPTLCGTLTGQHSNMYFFHVLLEKFDIQIWLFYSLPRPWFNCIPFFH